jgi:hypothetical protein
MDLRYRWAILRAGLSLDLGFSYGYSAAARPGAAFIPTASGSRSSFVMRNF